MSYKGKVWGLAAVSTLMLCFFGAGIGAQTPVAKQPAPKNMGQPSTAKGDWPDYSADLSGTMYSPQDQINASNFNQLQIAWTLKTDNLGPRPEYKLEGTALAVDGDLYAVGGTGRTVVALHGDTGQLKWLYSLDEGERAAVAPRLLSGRGVAYWTDGKGDKRILYTTTGYRMIELNAETGRPIESFGTHGMIDLKSGATIHEKQIDLTTGDIGYHSVPTVVKDIVIVGSSMREILQPRTHDEVQGLVRGYNVLTGKLLWTFHTVPQKGQVGYDSWLNNSADSNGGVGVWTGITADPALGLAYLATAAPTSEYYGGARPGNDLFGNSIICIDIYTGKMKWYYQTTHHTIWEYDMSAPPILADINVDGNPIKAVANLTSMSLLFTFNRQTGKPVWPIEEQPVEKGDVPGEWYSPTEPIPTKPSFYSRHILSEDELVNFTPELHQKALEIAKHFKISGLYTPPIVSTTAPGHLALLASSTKGTNWPGGGYDPELHIIFAPAYQTVKTLGLTKSPPGFSNVDYLEGTVDRPFSPGPPNSTAAEQNINTTAEAPAQMPRVTLEVQGVPIVKPPYGVLSAIDLNSGNILWTIPHGATPDAVRNSPALKGIDIPRTGQGEAFGVVVTKSLVIAGDPASTTSAGHPRGGWLRAYDKQTGKEVGAVWMPAGQSGTPMTYLVNGKQYIVVAVGGENFSSEYVAFTLPSEDQKKK